MITTIADISSLEEFTAQNRVFFTQAHCFAFKGEMGAGKTTLIQKILKLHGITDLQGSPTYSIINEYKTDNGICLYHLDCYRIKNDYEAFELGLEELLSKKNPIFIEWPEKINNYLPSNTIWVNLCLTENEIRTIEIADEYRS